MATVQSAREPRALARQCVRPTLKGRTCQGSACFRTADGRTSAQAAASVQFTCCTWCTGPGGDAGPPAWRPVCVPRKALKPRSLLLSDVGL